MNESTFNTDAPALEVQNLGRSFGGYEVLAGIDLSIQHGKCLTVVAPVGAGKTTLWSLLAKVMKPTTGNVRYFGMEWCDENEPEIRSRINVVPDHSVMFESLTVTEFMDSYGRIFGLGRDESRARVDELQDVLEFTDRHRTPLADLDVGTKRMLRVAVGLLNSPKLLLLDEPFLGMTDDQASMLSQLLQEEMDRGDMAVFATALNLRQTGYMNTQLCRLEPIAPGRGCTVLEGAPFEEVEAVPA